MGAKLITGKVLGAINCDSMCFKVWKFYMGGGGGIPSPPPKEPCRPYDGYSMSCSSPPGW